MTIYVVEVKFGGYGWLEKQGFETLAEARKFQSQLASNTRICKRVWDGFHFVGEIVN